MREIIEQYLAQGQVEGWMEKTVRCYRSDLDALTTFLRRRGCRRFPDVVPTDLDAYLEHVHALGRAKASRIAIASRIRRFFTWLQDRGLVVTNPARALPVPDDGEVDLPQAPLSEPEVQALFEALPRASALDLRNRAVLELLYGCGLRVGEAVALDVDGLDLSRRTVHVRESKGGQDRLLPLMGTAIAAVKDWLALRRTLLRGPDQGALFLTVNGRRLEEGDVRKWLDRLNRQRGPDAPHLHPHLFRHSIAVHLLRGGADIRHIQRFLGHANLDTTKVYLRMVPGRLKEDYEKAMPEIAMGLERGSG